MASTNFGDYRLHLLNEGYVGIGLKAMPSQTTNINVMGTTIASTINNFRLQLVGNFISHGCYLWSDSTLKTNITMVENALNDINKLNPPIMFNHNQK